MPGFQLVGKEEKEMIDSIFEQNKGIMFAHGFGNERTFHVREFERELAERIGVKYALAVSSGSAGLYVGLKALGIGEGDEVIVPAFTFIASIEAILMTGAVPVVVDIDESFTIDCNLILEKLTESTKAIMPVHMAGSSCDMVSIHTIAEEKDLYVIEDACQAMGARYENNYVGTFGDVGVYSFDAGKIIQAGEGGMAVTNNEPLYKEMRAIHDHGHLYSMDLSRAKELPLRTGFNFRMTELQGAVLRAQLKKLNTILLTQTENKRRLLHKLFSGTSIFPFKRRTHWDVNGEARDSLILIYQDKAMAEVVVSKLVNVVKIGTKNIPDALNWHFAGRWGHLFSSPDEWDVSKNILERSVAVPISALPMTDETIRKIVNALTGRKE